MGWRTKPDQIVREAHTAIANAEARRIHSFTEEDIQEADDEMMAALRYLRRALDAKAKWESVQHDDYEEYPHVLTPAEEQGRLI